MAPTQGSCSLSRVITYSLVFTSLLTLCSVALFPASSQAFGSASITSTNTQTFFTIGYSTSSVNVTVYTVRYTTSTQMLTNLIVEFTTITSPDGRAQAVQATAASAPQINSVNTYGPPSPNYNPVPQIADANPLEQLVGVALALLVFALTFAVFVSKRKN